MDLADLTGSPEPDLSWLVEWIQVKISREYLDSEFIRRGLRYEGAGAGSLRERKALEEVDMDQ